MNLPSPASTDLAVSHAWLREDGEIFSPSPDWVERFGPGNAFLDALFAGVRERVVRHEGAGLSLANVRVEGHPGLWFIWIAAGPQPQILVLPQQDRGVDTQDADFTRFVSELAHEVNNPLAFGLPAAREAATALAEGNPSSADLAPQVALALRALERVDEVVSNLRAFRPQGLTDEKFDLNVRVVETVEMLRQTAPDVRYRYDLAAVPAVLGHHAYLGQVLLNVLKNATSAVRSVGDEHKGEIRVSTWVDGERVYIRVRDNGPGIPEVIRDRLFQPFVSRRVGGTGLGLSVCANLLRYMGGGIRALPADGRGACFQIRLRAATDGELHAPKVSETPAVYTPPETVLIVDDERFVRRVIDRALGADRVHFAANGKEAVDWLKKGLDVNLVVCDRSMPVMTGEDVFRWIANHRPALASRFLFVSGLREQAAFGTTGGPVVLQKPFSVEDLRAAARRLLVTAGG